MNKNNAVGHKRANIAKAVGRDLKVIRQRLNDKIIAKNGCWEWIGHLTSEGYPIIALNGHPYRAHRVAYLVFTQKEPPQTLDHLCRNRACVNPEHLEGVTLTENTMRGMGPTAVNARKTICLRGHPLTPDNLYYQTKRSIIPHRSCIACKKIRKAAYDERDRLSIPS